MILGIISDTHGQREVTACALKLLHAAGADAVVHCGDVGGAGVFDELAGRRAWFVWGNSDIKNPQLVRYVETLGLPVPTRVPTRIELAGRRIAVFHGHELEFESLANLLHTGGDNGFSSTIGAEYVLFGHTHRAMTARVGSVRLVNPGALHRARPLSVATLELETDRVRFWRVPEPCQAPALAEWNPASTFG